MPDHPVKSKYGRHDSEEVSWRFLFAGVFAVGYVFGDGLRQNRHHFREFCLGFTFLVTKRPIFVTSFVTTCLISTFA